MNNVNSQEAGTESDLELAVRLAGEAGRQLMEMRAQALREDVGPTELKNSGDALSQAFLGRELSVLRPADMVLSEEALDDASRTTSPRVWIIDPLDGTREFSEGRHDWAVHVALWCAGRLEVGAVALPGLGLVLNSGTEAPKRMPLEGPLRLAVSRSRASELVKALAERLDAVLVPMGSAGYKVGAVVRGDVDAYVHSGGQYEWDSAAPVAVAGGYGLHVSRIDGSELAYNQQDPYLPDLLVCRPELAATLLAHIAQIHQAAEPHMSGLNKDGMYAR
ncbi:MAG: 3'(2'),5'-bisphosphate nucleotidase CysQ [Specibacter sp.]